MCSYYVARHSLDNLQKVGNHTFRGSSLSHVHLPLSPCLVDNIYNSLKLPVKQAVLELICKERDGKALYGLFD